MKTIVVIPAYEPNEKLIQLTTKLIDKNLLVIVVDDCKWIMWYRFTYAMLFLTLKSIAGLCHCPSIISPVSSNNSLSAASSIVSPLFTNPPGSAHAPLYGNCALLKRSPTS